MLREKLDISKERVVTGKITVRKTAGTEMDRQKVELMKEDIDIERVPVNRETASMPETRIEGNVTIIPIVREVAVVTKILMVTEEVRITKKVSGRTEEVEVQVRRENIEIERQDG